MCWCVCFWLHVGLWVCSWIGVVGCWVFGVVCGCVGLLAWWFVCLVAFDGMCVGPIGFAIWRCWWCCHRCWCLLVLCVVAMWCVGVGLGVCCVLLTDWCVMVIVRRSVCWSVCLVWWWLCDVSSVCAC